MDIAQMIDSLGNASEAARKLGVNRSTASRLRRGLTSPSYRVVAKLLELQEAAVKAVKKGRR
jgi:transcriptional regulator with XRE-family HTH domain